VLSIAIITNRDYFVTAEDNGWTRRTRIVRTTTFTVFRRLSLIHTDTRQRCVNAFDDRVYFSRRANVLNRV